MARRPSLQFYPADWRSNAKLRRCSFAERGIWLEVMCLMHDNDEYGVLRWPLRDIAQAIGCRVTELRGLRAKEVLKGADEGQCSAFVYRPRHAGQDGEPVTLLPEQAGPIWFSSRMVRDEYVRSKRGEGTRFGESPKGAPNRGDGESPKVSPIQREGDGPSVAVAVSRKNVPPADAGGVPGGTREARGGKAPDCPHEQIIALYHELMPLNPRVLEWNDTRRGYLRTRWREKAKANGVGPGYSTLEHGLDWWRQFFEHCAQSRFLTGRVEARGDRPLFTADLEWLLRPSNFARVIEGKYHDGTEQRVAA